MLAKLSNRLYAGTRGWHILLVLVLLVGWMMMTLPGLTAVSHNIEGLDTANTMAKFSFIYVSLALVLIGMAGAIRRKFNKIVAGKPASAIK